MHNLQHELKDKALFNTIAKGYFKKDIYTITSLAREFQLKSLTNMYLKQFQKKGLGSILELGCGVGASTKYLEELYNSYIGIDYAENFINLAQVHFADNNNKFICANIKDFNFNVFKKVDFVFGVGVLHHVDVLEQVLLNIKKIGNKDTIYGFIEPQSSNPLIQLIRKVRMIIDKNYSVDQFFFKKKQIKNIFEKNGYKIVAIKYQGYFTPPFAQVIFTPAFIFKPIIRLLIFIDKLIQNRINNPFSWNIIWIAVKE